MDTSFLCIAQEMALNMAQLLLPMFGPTWKVVFLEFWQQYLLRWIALPIPGVRALECQWGALETVRNVSELPLTVTSAWIDCEVGEGCQETVMLIHNGKQRPSVRGPAPCAQPRPQDQQPGLSRCKPCGAQVPLFQHGTHSLTQNFLLGCWSSHSHLPIALSFPRTQSEPGVH
jgi:hypothetical protein